MKFLAFLIVAFVAFWFLFASGPNVSENININNSDEERKEEPQRKKLADMNMRDLHGEVHSGLNKIDNTISEVTTKTNTILSPVLENENVAKFMSGLKIRWANFKEWIANLPGIKQYRNSIYSEKNWKREMDSTDFAEYTSEKSAGARMLREGTSKWKQL